MDPELQRAGETEWLLWRDLVGRMEETKLVTRADMEAPMNENDTPGKKLVHAIIAWGDNNQNEIARRTVNRLVNGEEYVLTAIREWGSARRRLNALADAAQGAA